LEILTTARGSQQAVDLHGFRYHLYSQSDVLALKDYSVRLISQNSSPKRVGENTTRQQAKILEMVIIKKSASLPGTSNKAMLCEILDRQDRILSTMKHYADLSPTLYMHTLAKLIIAK